MLADFEKRMQDVRLLFENPVMTMENGRVVDDVDATKADAISLLLGSKPRHFDPHNPKAQDLRNIALAKRQGRKSKGVLE